MATKPVFDDVQPWPEAAKPADGGMGHNRPPAEDDVKAQFREELLTAKPDFDTRLDQIEAAADRVQVTDDETLGRAGDMVRIIRATDKLVSETHTKVKAPYLTAGRVCDAEKNALTGRLAGARSKVEQHMNRYAQEKRQREIEEQRKAEEERRRLEELARENELEEALPPPPPVAARPEPVRSDGGATVSTQVDYISTVEDYSKAFRKVKDDASVREAIDKAIQRIVKATKGQTAIPGVRIDECAKALAR
ncbi:hypothetical protein [Croceibacterium aestuarii]|uniref:hypothetical protein n=1 Tax=Croceibacterium aestuarii TaxID=3064139 RepID=UPI00272E133F|nr:hypothetical protein [Croceibacterium sp. D39]